MDIFGTLSQNMSKFFPSFDTILHVLSGSMPTFIVGFWLFIIRLDQFIAAKICNVFVVFGFILDIQAVEISVAITFFLFLCFYWRKIHYFVIFMIVLYALYAAQWFSLDIDVSSA